MSDRERFLVVGADGLIGRSLMQRLSEAGHAVLGTTRRTDSASPNLLQLDLGGDLSGWQPPAGISAAFLCAAITSQEGCKKDPAGTFKVNVSNTVAVAKKLIDAGAPVVFLSTNLVFDGSAAFVKPTDQTNPLTEYGRQKRAAEKALLALGGKVSVLRLSKVFYSGTPLLTKWSSDLRATKSIYPLTNLICSPIPLHFVIEVMTQAGRKGAVGIFQLSGERDISYADIALQLAKKLKLSESLVCPRTSQELGLKLEHLPQHTTMDGTTLASGLGLHAPKVADTLDSIIAA